MAGWLWQLGPARPPGLHPCINLPSPHASPLDLFRTVTWPIVTEGGPAGHLVKGPRGRKKKPKPGRGEAAPRPRSCVFQSHVGTTVGTNSSPPLPKAPEGPPAGLPLPLQGPEPGQVQMPTCRCWSPAQGPVGCRPVVLRALPAATQQVREDRGFAQPDTSLVPGQSQEGGRSLRDHLWTKGLMNRRVISNMEPLTRRGDREQR